MLSASRLRAGRRHATTLLADFYSACNLRRIGAILEPAFRDFPASDIKGHAPRGFPMVYFFKDAKILELAKGKRVLHIGCVGFADLPTTDRIALANESLHYALSRVADVTGVDYSRDAIDYFRDHGVFNNVVYGNAEKLEETQLEGTFDVEVVGDIVEHLSNPGLMFEGLRRVCNERTSIVITTPHSFGLLSFLKHCLGRFVEGNEHVMTFNAQNIENLCARHGFGIVSIDTCYQKHAMTQRMFSAGKLFFNMFPRLGGTLFVVARFGS